jgi:hypothetical protein
LLYDKHNYKLVKNNKKTIIFDNWEDAKAYWFQNVSFGNLSYFEVLDKDTLNKKEKRKGFR